jgi:hypothetical protein
VLLDELAEAGGALLSLLEVVSGRGDLVDCALVDDDVGLLLDDLDEVSQVGIVERLAGAVLQTA